MNPVLAAFCARIGADPLLVQGAGGNVSYKDGHHTLWIKASGTWLRDAEAKDIFVPVALGPLEAALQAGDYGVKPALLCDSALKPSIETLLHALMPQTVVVHLHAIEALARLVREDGLADIEGCLAGFPWQHVCVPYFKPGAELAQAVAAALSAASSAQIVFLANHGIVLAADTFGEIERMLAGLIERLACAVPVVETALGESAPQQIAMSDGALLKRLLSRSPLHILGTHPDLFRRVREDWALYPDHVVFMGANARAHASAEAAQCVHGGDGSHSGVHVIAGCGVYVDGEVSEAVLAQLTCYFEVVRRQGQAQQLRRLSDDEVAALMNWDAELYRRQLSKA